MREMVTISFEASITLPIEEFDAALGDAAQAVQNAVGHTGTIVISADADHIDEDPIEDVSLDALAEREYDEADRRWPSDEEYDRTDGHA